MKIEIKAPTFPETIHSGYVSEIYTVLGQEVKKDEALYCIETDKVILEVVAPADGKIIEHTVEIGEHVHSQKIIGFFEINEITRV